MKMTSRAEVRLHVRSMDELKEILNSTALMVPEEALVLSLDLANAHRNSDGSLRAAEYDLVYEWNTQ